MKPEMMKVFFWILVGIVVLGFVYVLYVGFSPNSVFYSPNEFGENFDASAQPCGRVTLCEASVDCPNSEPCINGVCLT